MQGEHLQTVVFAPTEGRKGGLFSSLRWKKSTYGFESLNLDHYLMLQIKEDARSIKSLKFKREVIVLIQ